MVAGVPISSEDDVLHLSTEELRALPGLQGSGLQPRDAELLLSYLTVCARF